jgi:hypothetical protein
MEVVSTGTDGDHLRAIGRQRGDRVLGQRMLVALPRLPAPTARMSISPGRMRTVKVA